MAHKILVIHGPNLNLLGTREPDKYGDVSLDEINRAMQERANQYDLDIEAFQSNHEGAIVDRIQAAIGNCDGLIINPAAYTHTSIAIRDAILMLDIPIIEVHLSNIYRRETFRHHSFLADVATGQITGFGMTGYLLAVEALSHLIAGNS